MPIFYHGSGDKMNPGDVLTARGPLYESDWKDANFYAALERHRPADKLAHRDAVFMVCVVDDVDLAAGGPEYIFEVLPIGPVSKHDMNWSGEIACLISDGLDVNSDEVRQAARSYWVGNPSPNETLWEYLASSAKILRVEVYATFETV